MWLKRTTEEIAEVKRKQRVSRVRAAVLAGSFLVLLTPRFFGVYEAADRGGIWAQQMRLSIVCRCSFLRPDHGVSLFSVYF